ncbi:MAG: outer membrane beta-barrel protein, partial [Deltaproteobacteria bacterium]|nr:outer membrane beta-barrel protein [Deltaproteobacteria bacterium]
MAVLFWVQGPVYAQDAKGLAPGWLSLDSSVGLLDKKVEDGKSVLEKALTISISGFLDTSYTWSSNHPAAAFDRDISGRYFDQDHNDIVFNHFNLTLEKPEKDWGVGLKLVADFGRTAELLREATFYGVNKAKGAGNGGEPSAELREAFLT